MATIGNYCKAYYLERLRKFSGWSEKAGSARPEKAEGAETEQPRELTGEAIVYVQENYVVTDGIFKDEHILFDDVTPEWVAYCQEVLGFEIPVYEPIEIAEPTNEGK